MERIKKKVRLICPRCRGTLYEDEVYFELGEKKIELSCYLCPHKIYARYGTYIKYLRERVSK